MVGSKVLAASGSTGNNTHSAIDIRNFISLSVQYIIEAVGGTPTVDFKVQVSFDGTNWEDMPYLLNSTSDTPAVAVLTKTAVGSTVAHFACGPGDARLFRFIRLVTANNTNVTYRALAWVQRSVNG